MLAAGVGIHELFRYMGTSLEMMLLAILRREEAAPRLRRRSCGRSTPARSPCSPC
jgi:hypothetical protein